MLQVRANSWHYWVWRLGRAEYKRPKNLCRYFWHCTFKIVAALIVTGLMVTGITAIGILIWSFPIVFSKVVILLAIAAGLFVVLGYIVGAWVDRRKATEDEREKKKVERLVAKSQEPPKPPSTLGLIWAFIKAKKEKYCPLIQVVDK
jgi:hypothetical protein